MQEHFHTLWVGNPAGLIASGCFGEYYVRKTFIISRLLLLREAARYPEEDPAPEDLPPPST